MLTNLAMVGVGIVGLFLGGNWLVKGASRLAAALGLPPLVIGLTVVSFGTSAPELLVCLNAAINGSSDIAIGNVLGSNIANVGLILGLSGLLIAIPIHISLIKREIPFAIGASLMVFIMSLDGELGLLDGLMLIVGIIVFTGLLVRAAYRERLKPRAEELLAEEEGVVGPINRRMEIGRFVVGLALLLVASNLLVDGASSIARTLGVSEIVIGLTLVAIGTSLPELVTSLMAVLNKERDILFGNVVGSNIFNLLAILGVTAVTRPIPIASKLLFFEFPVMIGFALTLIAFALKKNRELRRRESALILAVYVGFILVSIGR